MGLRDKLTAFLAPDTDNDPAPQARDRRLEEVFGLSEDVDEVNPDREDIEDTVDAYYRSPIVRAAIQAYAGDVLAPGYRVETGEDAPEDLAEDLEAWLSEVAIIDGEFGRDFSQILREVVIDKYGRRGTALVEHVYDNHVERETFMALRPFRVETVTAYTRPGKNILLRPGDDESDFEARTPTNSTLNDERLDAPKTKAGDTACFVQFDDIFGTRERDEVALAIDDVTKVVHDTDTGDIFGKPATSTIADRALALEEKLSDLDAGTKAKAYKHWFLQLPNIEKGKAKELAKTLSLNDPKTKSVVNRTDIELDAFDGEVPDIVDQLQFDVEYIVSALPIPLYRSGFAGDINRDVTDTQQDSYRERIRDERRTLEARFSPVLEKKAEELTGSDDVDVSLRIMPEQDDSPLADETFDADDFSNLASGLKQMAPGGAVEQVMPPEATLEILLGLDSDEVLSDDAPGIPPLDEADERVQAAFDELYDTELASQYSEGDVVDTPQGLGVITAVETEDFEGKNGEVEASEQSPTYVIGLKDSRVGVGFYSASELSETEMPDTGVDDPVGSLTESESNSEELAETTFGIPDSWEESPKPNRLILLDAWSSMGGTFRGAKKELGSNRLAASMKDRVLQWEGWRNGGD